METVSDSDSDSNDGADDDDARAAAVAASLDAIDHEMQIMRRVFGKWARLAGVECKVVDELKEGEFEVDWTRAIAPRIEGRIICVGGEHK